MAQKLNQVPPNMEVWSYGSNTYLVRVIPGTHPPVPLVWRVNSAEEKKAIGITKSDRVFKDRTEFWSTGALGHGSTIELFNTTEDPWEVIQSNFATEAKVKPWLQDPEILNLWYGAALEGRGMTDAELQGTDWWRTHSEQERQWLSLNASDPATANRLIADNRLQVTDLFRKAGVGNATQQMVRTIADNWTKGTWTQAYATEQIRLLADPNLQGTLDKALRPFRTGLDTTNVGESDVRGMIQEWLGPRAAKDWSQSAVNKWASRFREDPDSRFELEKALQQHRLALFPEYANANLSYEDIAAPWRGVVSNLWGEVPDELDPIFERVVRLNDRTQAEQVLRTEGLKRGNNTVAQNLLSDMQVFGSNVRRSDPAIA